MSAYNNPLKNMIMPEDTLRLLVPARMVPDRSMVTKRSGEKVYTLRRQIRVFPEDQKEGKVTPIDGFFLCFEGDINQIGPETMLLWQMEAEQFFYTLERMWEPIPQ